MNIAMKSVGRSDGASARGLGKIWIGFIRARGVDMVMHLTETYSLSLGGSVCVWIIRSPSVGIEQPRYPHTNGIVSGYVGRGGERLVVLPWGDYRQLSRRATVGQMLILPNKRWWRGRWKSRIDRLSSPVLLPSCWRPIGCPGRRTRRWRRH